MGFLSKDKIKQRRQDRRERRKIRLANAVGTYNDLMDEGQERMKRVVEEGPSLRRREERIVRRHERVLVVFSEFIEENENKKIKERLYGFIEKSGIALPYAICRVAYDRIITVTGSGATLTEHTETLGDALSDADVEDVDLIWHGHGVEKEGGGTKSSMGGGYVTRSDICAAIDGLNADDRLRMFYTTACYGAALAEEMVDAGFSVGAGAIAVNTNSTIEFPLFLKNWAAGMPFGLALADGFKQSRWRATDHSIKILAQGTVLADTDSVKETFGDRATNIRSNGDF